MTPLLEVRELRTHFHAGGSVARAVDGVSLAVERGEALGIVGESGSGKSALALSILRLLPVPPARILPGSSVRFDGVELLALPESRMREVRGAGIGMVFQEPTTSLNPVLPVGEQIAEAVRAHRRAGKREARERAVELLRLVGIPDPAVRVDAYAHQLSGGQRQRVMIAMALSCEPALLIADEPTTALDVTIQAQILELLATLRRRLGMAMILISHDLDVVARLCDRVLVMYAGQVVEEGPATALIGERRHPYTRGLLAARPRLRRRAARLAVIPGAVPDATNWPAGCRFHPRCPYAWEPCTGAEPVLHATAPDRAARCWLEHHPHRREEVDRSAGGYTGATPLPPEAPR